MDQMLRPDELERVDIGDQTVSRRRFLNRARLGLIAVAGVAMFGIATTTAGVVAKESSDEEKEDKEKKEKQKVRDKDAEAKEKEKEEKQKEKESKNKNKENGSNTKKKTKSSNGDDSKKKKKRDPVAESPYQPFVASGQDKYGCANLANQWDAQQILRLDPKDPNGLDGNRNGIACDGQDAFMDGVPGGLMNSPFDLNPVPRR